MTPPAMSGWNLALRFALELMAFAALGWGAWVITSGFNADLAGWGSALLVPAAAAAVWGVFNVRDDPSRSGGAPVEVPGSLRLLIELAILGGGAVALAVAGAGGLGVGLGLLIVAHYVASWSRVRWLLHPSSAPPRDADEGDRVSG